MMTSGDSVPLTMDDGTGGGVFGDPTPHPKRFPHPMAAGAHLLFRLIAFLLYLLSSLFTDSFITAFVFVLILLSLDFWTVKNITGRKLVGLRWWNYVDESGKSHWVYESRSRGAEQLVSRAESRLFWFSLVGTQLVWSLMFIVALITLNIRWIMAVIVAFVMNGANLYGYIRCRYGAKKELSSVAKEFLGRQALSAVFSSFSGGNQQQQQQQGQGQQGQGSNPDFPVPAAGAPAAGQAGSNR
ncbi:hypothetical protein BOX15_Mlig014239g12 [Macrostomum lignano]|uniref:Golgi apparatus membrane protein TVP23 homolog n=1 Tax=Macrostomum lignano TaxID=282301 RepID=A0A267DEM5_9PLAT|nr:hypothetical protein BOX15_Mlig014239g12 [Macrostomum lignano]